MPSTVAIFMVHPSDVAMAVSIVHECSETCQFVVADTQRRLERETVVQRKLEYRHDYENTLYYLNVYQRVR